jgi:RNA polymerase sigma factor (TIGR02999 family)
VCENLDVMGPTFGQIPEDPPEDALDASPPAELSGTTRELFAPVYRQLRALAQKKLAHEPPGLTLQATALVHEVYLRLSADPEVRWENPGQFFAVAAESMRRILVERARRYGYQKRGGGRKRVELEFASAGVVDLNPLGMLALDEALDELRKFEPRLCDVVMLRCFAGLSVDEAAVAMGSSARTVKRDWSFARAWLARRLDDAVG